MWYLLTKMKKIKKNLIENAAFMYVRQIIFKSTKRKKNSIRPVK